LETVDQQHQESICEKIQKNFQNIVLRFFLQEVSDTFFISCSISFWVWIPVKLQSDGWIEVLLVFPKDSQLSHCTFS